MSSDLVELLKSCNQSPEPNLERLAAQYAAGQVDINDDEDKMEDDGDDDVDNGQFVSEDEDEKEEE
jgi:hypothetical protein